MFYFLELENKGRRVEAFSERKFLDFRMLCFKVCKVVKCFVG